MGQPLRMNEAIALDNVKPIRRMDTDDPSVRRPSFLSRRLEELGVIDMAPSTKPPGFYVNYSQVLFYLAVLGAILGGFWWTYDRIADANYQRGVADAEKRQIERRMSDDKDEQEKKNKALNDEIRILKEKVK